MISRSKGNVKALIASIIMVLLVENPIIGPYYFTNPTPLMASHYALAFSGGLIGYYYFYSRKSYPAYLGAAIIVLWHIPDLYVLSSIDYAYRALDTVTVFLAGFLIGVSVHSMKYIEKITLLVLWLIGDSTLAIALLVAYPFYSNPPVSFSPWSPSSEQLTGFIMMAIMMGILGFILFKAFKQFRLVF